MTGAEHWTLDSHGDSFEREWARHVLDDFCAYEEFWRKHVVPLSFRIREPDNQFIRPSLPEHLVALADASYAVFYHVAHGHAYRERLEFRKDHQAFPRPTECLYCFFAHAHSAHEALLHFCCAVNRVLTQYGSAAPFEIKHDQSRHPCRLAGCAPAPAVEGCAPVDVAAYERLQSVLSSYRNLLIHEKPIFLQNAWLPRTGELDKYSGLTGIGEVAKDPDAIRRDYRPVGDALVEILGLVKQVAQMVFGTVELLGGPAASTAVAAQRHAPRQLGEEAHVGRREPRRHPGRVVAVASVLAQEVPHVPDRCEGVVGHVECGNARGKVAPVDRQDRRRLLQQLEHPPDTVGAFADQSSELAHRTIGASGSDGVGVGPGPGELHRRDHDCCTEDAERRGDHLTGHLAEQTAATREVRRPVRECNAVDIPRARVEAESDVVRMTFGREVHLTHHRFEHRTEPAGET